MNLMSKKPSSTTKKKANLWRGSIENRAQAEQIVKNAANGFLVFSLIGVLGALAAHPRDNMSAGSIGMLILFALVLRTRRSIIAAWMLLVYSISGFAYAIILAVTMIWAVLSTAKYSLGSLFDFGSVLCYALFIVGLGSLFLIASYRAHTATVKLKKNDFAECAPTLLSCNMTGGEA